MCDELVKRLREHNGWALNETLDEAADAIEELMRRCEQFQYMPLPAWIPVTERLPERADMVLIRHYSNAGNRFYGLDVYDGAGWIISENVTHWMPLPEPPKEERKDDGNS